MQTNGSGPAGAAARAGGFTYLAVLFLVVVIGVGLAAVAEVWHTTAQRAKEAELLFVGDQFRSAIARYYGASPGAAQFPKSLEDLLEDKRFPNVRRYLRRIYVDPMTGKTAWGLTQLEGVGIVGVHSLSEAEPLKQTNFAVRDAAFNGAKTYRDWVFAFQPGSPSVGGQAAPANAATAQVQPIEPVPSQPPASTAMPVTRAATGNPATDLAASRKARERICQTQRRADAVTCQVAAQRGGGPAGERCNASIEPRYQSCLEGSSSSAVPLDTAAF